MEISDAIQVLNNLNAYIELQPDEKEAIYTLINEQIPKRKIKALILKKKEQIKENSGKIEKCRKSIMKEQELKKLQIYTLTQTNNLLELEIASLFELLEE